MKTFAAIATQPTKRLLIALVAASFFVSLAYSFYFKIHPVVDAQAYDQIAQNLVMGNGFKEVASQPYKFDTAIIRAGPGYEFFLYGLYTLFGHHYEVVWFVQAVLHALTAYLIFKIARLLFPEQRGAAFIASLLIAFSPDLVEIGAMLMTETLYLFLTVLVLYLFVKLFKKPDNTGLAIALGAVLGLALLTRPPLIFFIPVVWWVLLSQKKYKSALFFTISCGLVLVPWTIRNYLLYHQIITTTLIGQYNIWIGNTLQANGGQISGGFNPVTTYTSAYGFFGFKAKASAEFASFIFAHPFIFIKLCFIRLVRFFSLIRPMGFWFYQTGLSQMVFVASSFIFGLLLFVPGYCGLTRAVFSKNKILLFVAILAATAPLALLPTVVESRYRFQIYPFLALFAGYMFTELQGKKWWREKYVVYPVLVVVGVTAIDFFSSVATVLEHLGRF